MTRGMYEEESRMAAAISAESRPGDAARRVAEAVAGSVEHGLSLTGDGTVRATYRNSFGPTVAVDDVLERMTMADWRTFCDRLCEAELLRSGCDPDGFAWPTPRPRVAFTPEDDGTDVIAAVEVEFAVDDETHAALLKAEKGRNRGEVCGEETCCECLAQIRYRAGEGRTVVTCPYCGEVQPICSECPRPEREAGSACDRCELLAKCAELNGVRAKSWRIDEQEGR